MEVKILFKDNSLETFSGIRKVCNASTNVPHDWIYIYRIGDINGNPSLRFPMDNVTCIEVIEKMIDKKLNIL